MIGRRADGVTTAVLLATADKVGQGGDVTAGNPPLPPIWSNWSYTLEMAVASTAAAYIYWTPISWDHSQSGVNLLHNMKVYVVLFALALGVVAEPPVSRSYLPPSSEYGPPSASSLSSEYGAPSASSLSSQYGAPSAGSLSSEYGAPSAGSLSSQYGAPALTGAAFGRSGAPSQGPAARVSSSFGRASSRRLGAGRSVGGGLSTRYGAPSPSATGFGGLGLSTQYGAPAYSGGVLSTQYGAPSANAGGLSPVYGVPGYGYGRAGAQEDPLAEPANYEFSYSVEDGNTLSDFGHEESRQEESAEGQYRVLLPDGRKQIVTYQADEGGYRPTIEYQETGITAYSAGGYGYGRGRTGAGNGGYHY